MKLEQSFDVDAPLERVWDALVDVEHVAPCLPGAAVTGRNDDGSYNGTLTIKIGPTTASYNGKLQMEQIDEVQRTATMQAQGTDKRGQGGAKATIVSRLVPGDGAGTHVEVITDLHITGRLARFGRGGMMEDISDRMMQQFAAALQASLVGRAPVAPAGDAGGAAGEAGGAAGEAGAAAGDAGGAAEAGAAAGEAGGAAGEAGGAPGDAGAALSEAGASEGAAAPAGSAPTVPSSGVGQADSATLAAHPHHHSEPVEALSLGASVIWARVKRNPAPLGFVLGLLIALRFARRRAKRRRAD